MKQEASGWPEWCDNDDNKHKYINDYYEREGIQLDYDNIRKNPGLRSLAKLMLNSFWGKFGQRTNMQRLSHIADPAEFFDMLTNDEQTITGINFINDDIVELRWKYCDEFVESTGRTNVVIAAYTTALARLKLYSYLEVLGSRALYADTDSVIFKSGSPDLELGDYLGDLTNEVPEGDITVFVTGGPKNYAYEVKTPTGAVKTQCKIRGITLNYQNSLQINFNTVKNMVVDNSSKVTVTDKHKIVRDRNSVNILTTRQDKDYRIVFDKRIIKDNFTTVPYGFK